MVYGHFDLIIIRVLLETPFYPHFTDSTNDTKRLSPNLPAAHAEFQLKCHNTN